MTSTRSTQQVSHQDDNAPATKRDIHLLQGEMSEMKNEILRHFDVVHEDMRHDLLGANKDEISVLKDRSRQHGKRITYIEKTLHLSV